LSFIHFCELAQTKGINGKTIRAANGLLWVEASPHRDGCGLCVRGWAAQPIPHLPQKTRMHMEMPLG